MFSNRAWPPTMATGGGECRRKIATKKY